MKIIKTLLKILTAVLALAGIVLLVIRAAELIAALIEDRMAIDLDDGYYEEEKIDNGATV